VGDYVYLSTKNLAIPKERARKLVPRFIGPYLILRYESSTGVAELDLPESMRKKRIHPRFHVSLLRPFIKNNDKLFPNRELSVLYELDQEEESFVDEIIAHEWRGRKEIYFQVKWSDGDTTWEDLNNVNDLAALDDYLALRGVREPFNLPQKQRK
jgi:hypothetical protein